MVSIIPGMDTAQAERTDTSSGRGPRPNVRPVCRSSQPIISMTSEMCVSDRHPSLSQSCHVCVVSTKNDGTGNPRFAIENKLAPLPPSSERSASTS